MSRLCLKGEEVMGSEMPEMAGGIISQREGGEKEKARKGSFDAAVLFEPFLRLFEKHCSIRAHKAYSK